MASVFRHRKIGLSLFLLSAFIAIREQGVAQTLDSVIYKTDALILCKNSEQNNYTLTHMQTGRQLSKLKFAKPIYQYVQVLDEHKSMYFIGEDWQVEQQVDDFLPFCGNENSYSLTIKKKKSFFYIYEKFNSNNGSHNSPSKISYKVAKSIADSVMFKNGKSVFQYYLSDQNYIPPQNLLILYKNKKYFTLLNPKTKYDAMDFSNSPILVITKKGYRYGILNKIVPKYKWIGKFNRYLAEAETETGNRVYIDQDGKEY